MLLGRTPGTESSCAVLERIIIDTASTPTRQKMVVEGAICVQTVRKPLSPEGTCASGQQTNACIKDKNVCSRQLPGCMPLADLGNHDAP